MESPRDLREWQQTVERNLKQAKRSASALALAHAQKESSKVQDELQQFKDLTPAAPVELSYQTSIYVSSTTKELRARLAVEFADVTKATNGDDIQVSTYELAVRRIGMGTQHSSYPNQLLPGQSYPGTPGWNPAPVAEEYSVVATSPESEFLVSDLLPSGAYTFKVRAAAGSFIKPGLWSSERTAHLEADSTPPPQPSAPVATASRGVITVEWDGLSVSGDMPADFSYVELAQGPQSSPTERVAVFREAGFTVISGVPYNTPQFFRLRAFDLSGNPSPWSAQATATTQPLVDVDVILSKIDAATTEITNIGAESILSGAILSEKLAENAVTQAKLADSAVSLAKLDTAANDKITKGVNDAALAQGAAEAADSKAGTAQTAADKARAYADQIVASGASLLSNGGFEADEVWPTSASQAYDTTEKRSGLRSMKLTPAGVNLWPISEWVNGATGRTYRIEYWIKKSGTDDPALDSIGAVIQAKTAAGGTSTPVAYGTPKRAGDISTAEFTKVTVDYTVTTADVVQVRFAPWVRQSPNIYWVDDIVATDITDAKEALDAAAAAQLKADQAFSDAGDAMVAAGQAQDSANAKNNVYYLPALPSGTGFTNGDTTFIRSAVGQPITAQYTWDAASTSWKQETLSHQVIASLDMGKASVGELDGIFVKARSLEADRLLVGRGANLFTDPMIQDSEGWRIGYFTATGGRSGGGSLVIPAGTTQAGRYYAYDADLSTRRVRLVPGGTYRISGWVKTSTAAPSNSLKLYFRHQAEGSITGAIAPDLAGQVAQNPLETVPGVWTLITGMVKIPDDTTWLTGVLGAYKQSSYTTGTTTWSDLSVQQAMAGELVVDGSITGTKVDAQSVAAATGAFIDLDVSQLNATTAGIDTAVIDKLWADVVRSRKITTDMLVVSQGANNIYDEFFDDAATKTYRHTAAGSWGGWGRNTTVNLNWYGGTFGAGMARNLYFDTVATTDKNSYISVEPGQQFRFTAQYTSATSGPRATMRMILRNGATSYTAANFTTPAGTANVYEPAGSLRTIERIFTVPADVTHIMPALQFEATCTSGYVYGGATLVSMATGKLIVDGSVLTKHLTVTEDMTVKLLQAHKVAAGELAANAVEADNIKAGAVNATKLEAQLALVTEIIAGDPLGTHAKMDSSGFHVFAPAEEEGGLPYETVRMGVASSDDHFAVSRADSTIAASIDKDGNITGQNLFAEQSFTYRGVELEDYLDPFPQGIKASGFVPNSGVITNITSAWMRVMSVTFVAEPGRNYKAVFQGMHVYSSVAGDRANIKLSYVQNGGVPTAATPPTDSCIMYFPNANSAFTSPPLQAMGTFNATAEPQEITLMVWIRRSVGSGTISYNTYGSDPDYWKALRLWVEDMGPDIPESGTYYLEQGTSPATPAAPTKVTRTSEWGFNSVKSFTGSNAHYNYNTAKGYQGLSPAGVGNTKSLWTFPSLTTTLSGATIHDIWAYFYFEHWYYGSGGTARIMYHGNTGQPVTYSALGLAVTSGAWPRGAGRWVRIPDSLYAGFKSGSYKGFGLEGDSTYNTYGIANNARIRIKYTK